MITKLRNLSGRQRIIYGCGSLFALCTFCGACLVIYSLTPAGRESVARVATTETTASIAQAATEAALVTDTPIPSPIPTDTLAPTATTEPPPTEAPTTTPTPVIVMVPYTVQDGDTCLALSVEYGFDIAALIAANQMGETCQLNQSTIMLPLTATPEGIAAEPTATVEQALAQTISISIANIFYDGSGDKEPDEYIVIRNDSDGAVQLQGWRLHDEANHIFRFPEFLIQPGQECRIYTNEIHTDTCGFSFGETGSAVWNNSGDCVTLLDAQGNEVVKRCY